MIVWGLWETEKDATSEQIEWDAAPSGQDPQDLITGHYGAHAPLEVRRWYRPQRPACTTTPQ
jgi:hypothetical protein